MKRPELLSPAGNFECLVAAIEGGCDAVYLGGYTFGARSYALNFSNEELIKAIEYAHLYGVKVYVTVNTIIYENETQMFIEYVDFLHKNNVDAIIIQDLGMMDYLRKTYPKLEIHASTQMNVHSIEGVKLLESLGIKRVVLARESSIQMIESIKKQSNMPLEVFVQGALCFSYSGNCLMSSLLGGRSGNRGTCAQCCRMPYDLVSENKVMNSDKYVLSTRDLNTISNLGTLIDLGVESFKIEGRMKRPEYVYVMTKIYRKAIDDYLENKTIHIEEKDICEMKKIFNRKFTKGFIFNENIDSFMNQKRPNHQGIQIGKVIKIDSKNIQIELEDILNQNDGIRILNKNEDQGCIIQKMYHNQKLINHANKGDKITIPFSKKVQIGDIVLKTTDYFQLKEIDENIKNKHRKVMIKGKIRIQKNQPILLKIKDDKNEVIVKGSINIEESKTSPVSKERVYKQINKLGDTVFEFEKLEIEMKDNLFIPIRELNEIRREAINELVNKRIYKLPYQKEEYKIELKDYQEQPTKSILIHDYKQYCEVKNQDFDIIYIEERESFEKIDDSRKVLRLPRIIEKFSANKDGLLVSELGSLYAYSNIVTDFSFNVTNSYTVAFLHSLGVKRITLSYELSDEQIKDIITAYKKRYQKNPNLELIVSSIPEVMITKFPILKYYGTKNGYLEDFKHNQFKIRENKDYTTIFHFQKIERLPYSKYREIGIKHIRFIENEPT